MGPTYVLIILTCGVLLILMIILPDAFAQSDDLSSVLKNAQKSLGALGNKTPASPPITPHQSTIPKNVDMNVETTLIYDPSNENWGFLKMQSSTLRKGIKMSPKRLCTSV